MSEKVRSVTAMARRRVVGWLGGGGQRRLMLAAPPLALALLLAGCGGSSTPAPSKTPTPTATPKATSVSVETASVSVDGKTETVLTNSAGRTLYYFTKDSPTKIACSGTCAGIWPPFTTSASTVSPPSGVSGTFTIYDGANGRQVEYNGHPLYIYSEDTGPDQSHGEGVLGEWFVATPSLAPAAAASPTPTSSPSSSSGGY